MIGARIIQSARVETATDLGGGVLAVADGSRPAAQTPSLDDVLKRSAAYVAEFRKQLSGIVAEETYRQEIVNTGRIGGGGMSANPSRTLRSDLLLVKPSDADRYVELRDVFEVDGQAGSRSRRRGSSSCCAIRRPATRDRRDHRRERALQHRQRSQRNINTPLMALQFLDAANQDRFRFKHVEKTEAGLHRRAGRGRSTRRRCSASRRRCGRSNTRSAAASHDHHARPTASDRPAHGRFWINPSNGSVLISELIVDGGGVIATVTVSYQSEPLMGFLVPVEMRESYIRNGERISGHAEYGKFRQIDR